MNDTTTLPAVLADEMSSLAERFGAVRAEKRDSDLPGFDYFELFGWRDADADPDCAEQADGPDGEDVRVGGRLVLTLSGGRTVDLTEQETADVMWALANGTRRNRKAVRRGNNPEREARFARQQALMAKIVAAPEG